MRALLVRSAPAPLPARRAAALLPLALLLGGCALAATSDFDARDVLRPPVDAPARFEPADAALRLAPADTLAGGGCRSPLLDPRDGAELRMARSGVEWGDYQVPGRRYGVGAGELLRLECNTGRPIGVVRR